MESKPFVSVVTPVHNGEKYIAEAIESVLAQTFPFDEYIIVENCSTDNTLEIIMHYAGLDQRIQIRQTDHLLPQFENLNHTMRQISAQSQYCKVLHADDLLYPECISAMMKVAQAYSTAGIISAYRIEGDLVLNDGIPYNEYFLTGREVCRRSMLEGYFYVFGSPSSLLLRSDVVRNHDPFYGPQFFSDVEVCYKILKNSDFGFVHQVLTYSRLHEATYTSSNEGFGVSLLGNLNVLHKFGEFYLTPQELRDCIKKRLHEYYRFLGISFLQGRESKFWEYQEETLDYIGLRLDRKRVAISALAVFTANLTHPEQYQQILQYWFKRQSRPKTYRL